MFQSNSFMVYVVILLICCKIKGVDEMKKTAITVAGVCVMISMLAGCGGNNTEEVNSTKVEVQGDVASDHDSVSDVDNENINVDDEKESEVKTNESHTTDSAQTEVSEKDIEKAMKEVKEAARESLIEEEKQMIDTSVRILEGAHIAVVSKSTDGEFWKLIKEGMEDAVTAVNEAYAFEKDHLITMNFEGAESELDVETQVNTIDAVISENPDVMCIAAGDMDSCQAQLEAARENGIPVVAFDSNVSESEMITAFRATDNMEAGRMAARKLAEELDNSGALGVFSAPEMTESGKNRLEGFKQELENYPEMEIVEIIYMDQVEDMKSAIQSAIVEHPELRGVFCTNATIAEMYLELDEILENRNILMVGMDATTVQQDAIHDGRQIGVVSQNPHMMGFETIWTALLTTVEDMKDVEFSRNRLLQPVWIDMNNIDDVEYGKYLY